MRKIALVNQKGGVGKTTTAVNLSAAIAKLDRRVLLIDLDPQSNATVSLGVPPNQQKNTSYALLNGAPLDPLKLSDNLHLVPSNIELAGAEMELTSVIGRESVLRDAVANASGYDFMILDCSPSLGLLSVNALTTANEVMVPLQCEFLALHGISLLIRTIELVKKRLNPKLDITGVIPCMYDVRKGLARDVVVEIEKHFGSKVFKTKIRSNVRLAEAPSHGKSIFEYAPESNGAEDYLSLAREVVGIELIEKVHSPYVPESAYLKVAVPEPEPVLAAVAAPAPVPVLEPPPLVEPIVASPQNTADEVFGSVVNEELPVPAFETSAPSEALPAVVENCPSEAPSEGVVDEGIPLVDPPALDLPNEPAPATPAAPAPLPAVEESLVEFIELIPLEIEDLPDVPTSGA
ncbi:MAG TPA: ParA family protein [Planctomycetota bacterium]|jgi:chromosome partitioning protein|nr:ParA family protein [Planctomycetota bacterium]